MKDPKKVAMGKKNKAAGSRFELKVRKELEFKGWVVSKWMNQVETGNDKKGWLVKALWKLIPAKHKFCGIGRPMAIGTGFPDFIVFIRNGMCAASLFDSNWDGGNIGVEAKSNGQLDKLEKEKCEWLLENNIFSKILIAKKGTKRGEVEYKEFKI